MLAHLWNDRSNELRRGVFYRKPKRVSNNVFREHLPVAVANIRRVRI